MYVKQIGDFGGVDISFLVYFQLISDFWPLGSVDLAATSGVANIEGFSATSGVLMNMGLSATLLFGLWVVAAAVFFGVSWAAAEVLFEAVNFSVVAVVFAMFGVYIVASDAFLWGLVVSAVSPHVFFLLGTVSFVFFTSLSEVGLWPWLGILEVIASSTFWLWC